MKIFCLVLNYKNHLDTQKCVTALLRSDTPRGTQILILDNSSDSSSARYLKKIFPEIKFIKNNANLGFAGGNNIGINYALKSGASHLLIINPDVLVGRNFFRSLLADLRTDTQLGLVAPAIKHRQKGHLVYGLEGHLDWSLAKATHTNLTHLPKQRLRVGDFVTFACVLIKAEVFRRCGLLDERYFMYLEDVDYCLTAAKAGFRAAVDPRVVVSHRTSSSFKKPTDKLKISFFSQLKFILKWLPFPSNFKPLTYALLFYPYLYLLWTYQSWKHSRI